VPSCSEGEDDCTTEYEGAPSRVERTASVQRETEIENETGSAREPNKGCQGNVRRRAALSFLDGKKSNMMYHFLPTLGVDVLRDLRWKKELRLPFWPRTGRANASPEMSPQLPTSLGAVVDPLAGTRALVC